MGSCPQSLSCTQGLKEHPCTLCMHPSRRAHACQGMCLHMRVCTNPAPRHPRGAPLAPDRAGWGAACPSARPLHPTLDQSCLHPTSQSLWTSGFQLSCIQSAGKRTPRPPQCMPLGTAGGGPRSPRGADKRVQGTGPWQCQAGCPLHAAPGIQPCAWGGGAEGGA